MDPVETDPRAILLVLNGHAVQFVAIGGWAAGVQGAVWPTFDVDIVIRDEPSNLERLAAALADLNAEYDTLHQPPIRPELKRLSALSGPQLFRTKHGRLDILKEAGGDTSETLLEDAAIVEQAGKDVFCASLRALLRMKRAANRQKDQLALGAIEKAIRRQAREEDE